MRAIIIFPLLLSGCLSLSEYDPITLEQVEATIKFEAEDYRLSKESMESAGADDRHILELDLRHESEMMRLRAWLELEKSKKLPEDTK